MIHQREKQGNGDNDHGQGADRWVQSKPHPLGDLDGKGRVLLNGENGGVVVLERSKKSNDRGRQNGGAQKWQQNFAKRLHVGGAKIESGLHLAVVEPLEAGKEHQHAIGSDEGRLGEHGEKHPVLQETVGIHAEAGRHLTPKQHGGDADYDAGHQDGRRHDDVVDGAGARENLRQQQRAGETNGDRQKDDRYADDDGIPQAKLDARIGGEPVEPFEGEALPRIDKRKGRAVESRHRHDNERPEQIGKEQ